MGDLPNSKAVVTLSTLQARDVQALLAIGVATAEKLRLDGVAVFMADALGNVVLMPTPSIKVLDIPKIPEDELFALDEDRALQVLVREGHSEKYILDHMARRKAKETCQSTVTKTPVTP